MSIGIDFVIRASTAAFTRGLATVNNQVKDLRKSFRDFNVGGGLGGLIGVGGVIAGFRSAITNAQELRAEAAKVGKEVDSGTASVARFGDALGGLGRGFRNAMTDGLSFFTSIGDKARQFFQGVTAEQEAAAEKMAQTTGKLADEAEARLKRSREANSPEKQAAAQEKLSQAEMESALKGTDAQKKLLKLTNERADLNKKLRDTPVATVAYKELQAQILRNDMDTKDAAASFDKEASQEQEKADKKRSAILDKIAPTVEELAAQETGGWVQGDDPRLRARQALEAEKWARELGQRGDIKGALKLQERAEGLRKGLSDVTAQSQTLTPDSAKTAVAAALETTNAKLDEVTKAVSGIIKAQK
jgi:hypothetical protein